MNKEFLKMQKLAGVITESQYNQKKSLVENQLNENEIKSLSDRDMYSIKEPNSAVLANGEKPFSLSPEELKPIEDTAAKENIAKFKKMIKSGPDIGILSLANNKNEQRILKFFKSDKDNYYITVVGPGETSFDRTKHYTTNSKSAFTEFIKKTLEEFSDWCDKQQPN